MVISAFVRPLHAVLVQHSRYQSIQDDILPPLGGRWWFASGNNRLCFQQYFASYTEAVSAVLNSPLGGEDGPALVAAPSRALCEVGVAVIALTALPPMGTEVGTSTLLARTALPPTGTDAATSTLLALAALPPMLAEAGTSTLLALAAVPPTGTEASTSTLLAMAALPPMLAEAGTSTLLAIILLFSMRTQLPNTFRLLWYFNTFFHQFRHELERVCGSSPRCYFNTFSHLIEIELGMVLVWEFHERLSMVVRNIRGRLVYSVRRHCDVDQTQKMVHHRAC
jgi:hypothetical protein